MEPGRENRRILILCCLVGLVLLGMASFYLHFSNKEEPADLVTEVSSIDTKPEGQILVYVVGAVKEPGVYELPADSHLYDAVKAAGDVLPYADMEAVNLADPVMDGSKVYIPLDPNQADARGNGLISINQASSKELEALPGIGAVTAEKIVNYREEHGPFQSKEDIKKVPSIGEGKYKKFSDRITV